MNDHLNSTVFTQSTSKLNLLVERLGMNLQILVWELVARFLRCFKEANFVNGKEKARGHRKKDCAGK